MSVTCSLCGNELDLSRKCSNTPCLEADEVRRALTLSRWEVMVRNNASPMPYSIVVTVHARTMEGARRIALEYHSRNNSATRVGCVHHLQARSVRNIQSPPNAGPRLASPWVDCPHDVDWSAE